MQICEDHYERMKRALKDRGLWELVPNLTAEQACQREVDSLSGIKTDWDPLVTMVYNFYGRGIEQGGLYLLAEPPEDAGFVNDQGERQYCPLCEVKNYAEPDEEGRTGDVNWIETCADTMLGYARAKNLIPGVQ